MEKINTKQELHEIIDNNEKDTLAIIKFSAQWCGPCRQMENTIEAIEKDTTNVKFYNVDVDDLPELAEEFDVMSIPVLLFYKGSFQVDRTLGGLPESKLREKIEENNNK
jgi:thioredoxin 1